MTTIALAPWLLCSFSPTPVYFQEESFSDGSEPRSGVLVVEAVEGIDSDALWTAIDFSSDRRTGIVVGGRGEADPGAMLRTTDHGHSWSAVALPGKGRLYDVAFTDEHSPAARDAAERASAIVVVGLFGTVLRSIDTGTTWTEVREGDEWLSGVAFPTEQRGVAVGASRGRALILASDDSGLHWSEQEVPAAVSDASLRAIEFRDALHGLAVGTEGALLETDDAGRHWRAVETGGGYLRGIDFSTAQLTHVVGGPGILLRHRDGDPNWQHLAFQSTAKLNSIRFLDADHGLLTTMEGQLLITRDGGVSWTELHRALGHLTGIDPPTADRQGTVVGDRGTVLRIVQRAR